VLYVTGLIQADSCGILQCFWLQRSVCTR